MKDSPETSSDGFQTSKRSRQEFYRNIKPMYAEQNSIEFYEHFLRKRTADLKEIISGIQQKKRALQTYTTLALFSSVLCLIAITLWLYQSGLSSPFLSFFGSAALLAILNLSVGLKVRSLLNG
jgi:hypothetical protein